MTFWKEGESKSLWYHGAYVIYMVDYRLIVQTSNVFFLVHPDDMLHIYCSFESLLTLDDSRILRPERKNILRKNPKNRPLDGVSPRGQSLTEGVSH